jgi:hypothetical protein
VNWGMEGGLGGTWLAKKTASECLGRLTVVRASSRNRTKLDAAGLHFCSVSPQISKNCMPRSSRYCGMMQ